MMVRSLPSYEYENLLGHNQHAPAAENLGWYVRQNLFLDCLNESFASSNNIITLMAIDINTLHGTADSIA